MVERKAQEGMAAPIPETKIRILRETTLAELGFDTSFDSLGLASDRFTLGVKKVGEETVFVGLLNHPFAGGHFAQFLNSVSPFPDQSAGEIIADVNLPILAERDYRNKVTSGFTRQHERHLQDPRVGPPYVRFAEDHALAWVKALESKSSEDVFWVLERIRFVENLEQFTAPYFSKMENDFAKEGSEGHSAKNIMINSGAAWNVGLNMLQGRWESGDDISFKSFFCGAKGLPENIDWDKLYIEYSKLSVGQGIEFIRRFFDTKPDSKSQFMLFHYFPRKQVLVDLESGFLRGGSPDPNLQTRLIDAETLEISDKEGTSFLVVPNKDAIIPGGFGWRIKESKFSREYTDCAFHTALYPTFAWKRDGDGTRTFLTQQEAMPLVREFGFPEGEQGDVKLGEIGVGYFSRDIIKKWPVSMALKPLEGARPSPRGDDFEQPMRGAQMPAWVALERHKDQLLNNGTSPLAIIEKSLDLAA